jgi:simple sugar transport system substrate-binding protein
MRLKTIKTLSMLFLVLLFLWANTGLARTNGKIVVGFSQIGAESSWRVANTKSIKQAADQAGIYLTFQDAQQKQSNQIKAIKTFIMQKVDVIALAPIVKTGWHSVLLQAKRARIPVILLDRQIDERDANLYATMIGSDFREEGLRAGRCLVNEIKKRGLKNGINIVELKGTTGSAPAIERSLGFAEAIREQRHFRIVRSAVGDFKEARGKEVMEAIVRSERAQGRTIHALYAHNDNMALGAIPSLEAAGLIPGKNVVIASVDAINDAIVAMEQDKINCIVECSPLLGPQLMAAVRDLVGGRHLPRKITIQEAVFSSSNVKQELPQREY